MLDARFIRENIELVEARLGSRGTGIDLEGFRTLDARRRAAHRRAPLVAATSAADRLSAARVTLPLVASRLAPDAMPATIARAFASP